MLEFLESLAGLFGFGGTATTQPKPPRPSQTEAILCVDCDKKLEGRLRPPSRITFQKLRAGNFPSEFEASQVLQLLEESQEGINQYDAEIACLETMLAKHKEGRADALRNKEYTRGLLAPIRKLPLEVLTIIFEYHCEEYSLLIEVVPSPKMSTPALDLAQTCSLWRNLALSRPSLWSHLMVDLEYRGGRIIDLVDLHLCYSKASPLKLFVEACEWFDTPTDLPRLTYNILPLSPSASWLLQRLLFACTRWQTVFLHLNSIIFSTPEFKPWSDPAWHFHCPLLEDFQFVGYNRYYRGSDPFFENLFRHAPALHTVKLDGIHQHLFPSLPFEQIRSFETSTTFDLSKLPDLFENCLNLESLRLTACPYLEPSLPEFKSTSVRSLTVEIRYLTSARKLFSRLTLPSLTALTLHNTLTCHKDDSESVYEISFDGLLQSLAKMLGCCSLKSLTFEDDAFTSEELAELFGILPLLTHLSIRGRADYISFTDLFTSLTWPKYVTKPTSKRKGRRSSKPVLLPHLQSLELLIAESHQHRKKLPSPKCILSLVESRQRSVPIQPVSITKSESPSYNELSHLSLCIVGHQYSHLGPKWTQKFYSEVYPRLREFDGLILKLDLPV